MRIIAPVLVTLLCLQIYGLPPQQTCAISQDNHYE